MFKRSDDTIQKKTQIADFTKGSIPKPLFFFALPLFLSNLLQVIKDYGVRSMRHNGVIYPYWENAVRMTEDYLALLLVLIVFFAALPVCTVVICCIKLVVSLCRKTAKAVPERVSAARERKREEHYAKIGEK